MGSGGGEGEREKRRRNQCDKEKPFLLQKWELEIKKKGKKRHITHRGYREDVSTKEKVNLKEVCRTSEHVIDIFPMNQWFHYFFW